MRNRAENFDILTISDCRQEYLGMKSKYTALESKSKDMIVQQNNAVSGASIALSDLGGRLSSLVEQLVASYKISEQEIEVSAIERSRR